MIDFNEIVRIIIARGYRAEIREVAKDGTVREAISIARPESNISPVIYLDTFNFSEFENLDAIADELISIAEKHFLKEDLDLSFIYDWEQVKSKLYLCMGYRCNFNPLIFTKPFLADIVQYIRIKMDDIAGDEGIVATVVVSNDMAQHWRDDNNLDADEIFAVATANAQDDYIVEDLWIMFGADPSVNMSPSEMLVLSNQDKHYGAGVLTCTKILNETSDRFGGKDFYIVPSSTHEVLAIRPRDEVNADSLRSMVQMVNDNELTQKELLSYSVYFYERESETVKQAG